MTIYSNGEFHKFIGSESEFLYLVPSGGIFALHELSSKIISKLHETSLERHALLAGLSAEGYAPVDASECIEELLQVGAIRNGQTLVREQQPLPDRFPLQTMVLNVTNQCNLSCQYCYEFGEDRITTPQGRKKFMDWDTAKTSVEYLLRESEGRRAVHITFFGGETLMNFQLLKQVVAYARERAAEKGVSIDFSLTTNATLLTSAIIKFLAENEVGVTVSIDGPKEMNDQFRIFKSGRGSYDVIEPKVRELLASHRTRPIAARVTMTSHVTDVVKIYRHLKENLGFYEVGFAPVTTSRNRLYSIDDKGLDSILGQFEVLAEEYLEYALRGEHHGFSNVSDTLAELHQGVNKSHPCGAGLGLVGVGPSGGISPCHRFVDSDIHVLGHVSTGIDKDKRTDFLSRGHIDSKTDCHTCWARPLCAGGCHHEAYVRYGDTGHPNLHYCEWIRSWTDLCLKIYGTIADRNPRFLGMFAQRRPA